MLYGLLWLCLLAGVPLLLVVKFAGAAFWSIIATEAVMVVLLVMVKRGRIRIPSIAIPSIILVLVGVAMYHGQGIRDVATVGLFVVVSFAGLLLGVRGLLTFTVLTILTFGLISYFEISGVLIVPAYPETSSKHVVIFAATIALFAVLQRLTLQYLFDNLRAAEISERTLSQRNAELEASRAEFAELNLGLESRIKERTTELQAAIYESEQWFHISRDINAAQSYGEIVGAIARNLTEPGFSVVLTLFEHLDERTATKSTIYTVRLADPDGATPLVAEHRRTGTLSDWIMAQDVWVVPDFGAPDPGIPQKVVETLQLDGIRRLNRGHPIIALVTTQMKLGTRVIGSLWLIRDEPYAFTEGDVRLMRIMSGLAANAVERVWLYAEQVTAAQLLREADDVKSRFLASMSHELRTPLNAILNFTRFVSSGMLGPINAEQLDALNKTVSSGKHLLNLINDVLDVSKIESDMLSLFVEPGILLGPEIEAAATAGEALLADKPVTIVRDVPADLPAIVGDRRRIRQILLNLVSNSCKFTDSGTITIAASADETTIRITVTDTGPGIPPDTAEIIFKPFRQTLRGISHGSGTGLGLPIARKLAEAHQGRLWLDPTVTDGASFVVDLPIASEALIAKLPKAEDVS